MRCLYTLIIAVLVCQTVEAYSCSDSGQCTALDNSTCVPVGEKRVEECNIYRCMRIGETLTYKVTRFRCKLPSDRGGKCVGKGFTEDDKTKCMIKKCRRDQNTMIYNEKVYGCALPNGTCLRKNKRSTDPNQCSKSVCRIQNHPNGTSTSQLRSIFYGCPRNGRCYARGDIVPGDCIKFKCKISYDKMSFKWDVYGSVGCYLGNDTCLAKGNKMNDTARCAIKKCKVTKYKNGTVYTELQERFYGCPYKGVCEDGDTIRVEETNCTKRKCKLNNNGLFMKWKIIDQGCKSRNGTCYYDGQTWLENDSCFTYKCTADYRRDGTASSVSAPVGGVCKDADGKCKDYGAPMTSMIDGEKYDDCVCEETKDENGTSVGMTKCNVPA